MSDGEDEGRGECPLCYEEFDLTDLHFNPCPCGYRICLWCFHNINEQDKKDGMDRSRCPACRREYDDRTIESMSKKPDQKLVEKAMQEKRAAERRERGGKGAGGRQTEPQAVRNRLRSVRVIQRNLVYVTGLPLSMAHDDILRRHDHFGRYGRVLKVVSNRLQVFNSGNAGPTVSAYVTYHRSDDALKCIRSVDGSTLQNSILHASFGTTKYCSKWLEYQPCTNPDCMYLHDLGETDDSFTKDDLATENFQNKTQPQGPGVHAGAVTSLSGTEDAQQTQPVQSLNGAVGPEVEYSHVGAVNADGAPPDVVTQQAHQSVGTTGRIQSMGHGQGHGTPHGYVHRNVQGLDYSYGQSHVHATPIHSAPTVVQQAGPGAFPPLRSDAIEGKHVQEGFDVGQGHVTGQSGGLISYGSDGYGGQILGSMGGQTGMYRGQLGMQVTRQADPRQDINGGRPIQIHRGEQNLPSETNNVQPSLHERFPALHEAASDAKQQAFMEMLMRQQKFDQVQAQQQGPHQYHSQHHSQQQQHVLQNQQPSSQPLRQHPQQQMCGNFGSGVTAVGVQQAAVSGPSQQTQGGQMMGSYGGGGVPGTNFSPFSAAMQQHGGGGRLSSPSNPGIFGPPGFPGPLFGGFGGFSVSNAGYSEPPAHIKSLFSGSDNGHVGRSGPMGAFGGSDGWASGHPAMEKGTPPPGFQSRPPGFASGMMGPGRAIPDRGNGSSG